MNLWSKNSNCVIQIIDCQVFRCIGRDFLSKYHW